MIIELIAVLAGKAALAPLKTGLSILADIRDRRVRQVVERVGPLNEIGMRVASTTKGAIMTRDFPYRGALHGTGAPGCRLGSLP